MSCRLGLRFGVIVVQYCHYIHSTLRDGSFSCCLLARFAVYLGSGLEFLGLGLGLRLGKDWRVGPTQSIVTAIEVYI